MRIVTILAAVLFSAAGYSQPCDNAKAVFLYNTSLSDQENENYTSAANNAKQASELFRVCNDYPNYFNAVYAQAMSLLNVGQVNEGVESLLLIKDSAKHYMPDVSEPYALACHTLGEIYAQSAMPEQAVDCFERAADELKKLYSDGSEEVAYCYSNLATLYLEQGNYEKASDALGIFYQSMQAAGLADSAFNVVYANQYANYFKETDALDSAIRYYSVALDYNAVTTFEEAEEARSSHVNLGQLYYSKDNFEQANVHFLAAEELSIALDDSLSALAGSVHLYLGLVLQKLNQWSDAEKYLQKAYNASKVNSAENLDQVIDASLAYATFSFSSGKTKRALTIYREALDFCESNKCTNTVKDQILLNYAKTQLALGQDSLAADLFTQVITLENTDTEHTIDAEIAAYTNLAHISTLAKEWQAADSLLTIAETKAQSGSVLPSTKFELLVLRGDYYFEREFIDSAKLHYTKAEEFCEHEFGADHRFTMAVREKRSGILLYNGKYAEAEKVLTQIVEYKTATLGEFHSSQIETLDKLATALMKQGKTAEAAEVYQTAVVIFNKTSAIDSKTKISLYNNLGLFYKNTDKFADALDYFKKSIAAKEEIYGSGDEHIVTELNNLGTTYEKIGYYSTAAEYLDRAEKVSTSGTSKTSALSDIYINKGNLLNRLGQNDRAIEYYNQALELKATQGSDNSEELALIYNNIGALWLSSEVYTYAQKYFNKALTYTIEAKGDMHPETAELYNNLGTVYFKQKKFDQALDYYSKAGRIFEQFYQEGNGQVGSYYNNVAMVWFEKDQADSAVYYFSKAEDIYRSIYGNRHPLLSLICNNIGDMALKQNQYDEALKNYHKAMVANHRTMQLSMPLQYIPAVEDFYDQSIFLKSLLAKASAFTQQYMAEEGDRSLMHVSLRYYQSADSLVQIIRRSAVSKADKIAIGKTASECYEAAVEVCTELYQLSSNADSVSKYLNLAFYFAEKTKASVLLDAIAGQDAMKLASIPDSLKNAEMQLSSEIAYQKKIIAENGKSDTDARNALFTLNAQYANLMDRLETEHPEYFAQRYGNSSVSLPKLQSLLADDMQVRLYVLNKAKNFIFCIQSDTVFVEIAPVFESLKDSVKLYRKSIVSKSSRYTRQYKDLANRMYGWLFPNDYDRDNIKNLLIIPDGRLSQIPFESLLTEKYEGSAYDYAKFPFLIKSASVSYAYSASLLYRRLSAEEHEINSRFVGFAPVFIQHTVRKEMLKNDPVMLHRVDSISPFEADLGRITPLLSSRDEVAELFSVFHKKGHKASALMYENANLAYMHTDSLQDFGFIHFATHGFVNVSKPELSGIQLSPIERYGNNGMLYSNDIYNIRLNAKLVTLSACETGLGKISKGEGIIGLSRSFIFAGAENLVVSLWKVNDNSTSELMVDFYSHITDNMSDGKPITSALQQAKLSMANDKQYANPFYWAPFILLGY